MDFTYSEEQNLLARTIERLHRDAYGADARNTVAAEPFGWSHGLWQNYAKLGLLSLPSGAGNDGSDAPGIQLMIVMESIGRVLACEPYLQTAVLGGTLLGAAGGAMQAALLRKLTAGELVAAFAHAEDQGGDFAPAIATRVRRDGDGYRLSGRKTLVTHGDCADLLIVSARDAAAAADDAGISLFLVDRNARGLSARACRTIDGIGAADIECHDVVVGGDALLGPFGGAGPFIAAALDRAVAALCAEAVGIMQELNRITAEHLRTRRQFGVPIGSFQILQHCMVDMTVEYEHARSMAIHAALAGDRDDPGTRAHAVSAAKVRIGRAGRLIGEQAIQLHGAMGMSDEAIVSRYFKRLIAIEYTLGDEAFHLARFAATAV